MYCMLFQGYYKKYISPIKLVQVSNKMLKVNITKITSEGNIVFMAFEFEDCMNVKIGKWSEISESKIPDSGEGKIFDQRLSISVAEVSVIYVLAYLLRGGTLMRSE